MKRALLAATLAMVAAAAPATQIGLKLTDAWIPTAPPGIDVYAAYFTVESPSDSAWRIVGIEVEGFARAELHETVIEGDRSRMRRVGELVIPPRGRLVAAPGGVHAMLFAPDRPIVAGMKLRLSLRFAGGGDRLTTEAEVRDARDAAAHRHH
jgi:hypothetical protein